jgi:hypothetical protein
MRQFPFPAGWREMAEIPDFVTRNATFTRRMSVWEPPKTGDCLK